MNLPEIWKSTLESRVTACQEAGLFRSVRVIEERRGAHVQVNGHAFLNFSSNDYLGLATDVRLVEAAKKELLQNGVGSGAAHLVTGHSKSHQALEEELADFLGCEKALIFSTGYMANLGVLSSLAGRHSRIYQDRLNHASLLDGARLSGAKLIRYAHRGLPEISKESDGASLIVSDGVFSMDGDLAEVPELADLARRSGALLVIDDAHGIGVLGHGGRGVLEFFNLDSGDVPVLIGTLGKAFGTFGAFVAGSDLLVRYLIQKARTYIYTTAIPAALAEASRAALRIVREESWRRAYLQDLIKYFRSGVSQIGIPLLPSHSPIQPLVVGGAETATRLSKRLQEQGILLAAIRPPTVPEGTARLRCTLSAAHTHADLDRMLDALNLLREDFFETIP